MIKEKRQKEKKEQVVTVVGQPKVEPTLAEYKPRVVFITFDEWWSSKRIAFGLKDSLRDALKKHFEIRGFMASGKFDDGLSDFGIKS